MSRVVTLTTDFGFSSGYVAELKGRLLHARAACTLVDVSHDVPPQDIRHAAWLAGRACLAFPPGTLHILVIDPGVGTARRLVWARLGAGEHCQEFLCPDNGILSLALERLPLVDAREILVPPAASATFHGRDAIAPAAVRLLERGSPDSLGPARTELVRIPWPRPLETRDGITGEVVHVDTFGNLLTNLPAELWARLAHAGRLLVGEREVTRLVRTYADAPQGTLVALVGSQDCIEAAVVGGRADTRLAATLGTTVTVPRL
ncbi:MAG: S-adenosyl-l-methionine hydroxide adenosyltransferase family protein [Planctomycetia bacterium]